MLTFAKLFQVGFLSSQGFLYFVEFKSCSAVLDRTVSYGTCFVTHKSATGSKYSIQISLVSSKQIRITNQNSKPTQRNNNKLYPK